jgi:photosystem II stability/assembly factor-like uncharacterized protein
MTTEEFQMSIIFSVLLAFTQLSVEHPTTGAIADVVPAAGSLSLFPGFQLADSGLAPAAPVRQVTWNLQATLPNVVFIDLSFADDSVGYACAELGIVYKTTNSGATWSRIMNLGFPYYWYGVSAVSCERAIVSGFNNTEGTGIYRWTTDGGASWDSIVTLDTTNWLSRAQFADSLHGIISAGWNGGTWRTENGGRNPSDWGYVQVDQTRGWFEGNFCYRADGHCWLTGISFGASADHGLFWDVQHSADPIFDGGVWFSDTLHGWTGGGQISSPVSGWVHRTTDGGATWSGRLFEPSEPIRAVLFLNETLGFAVGGNHYSGVGAIYSTMDGGDSWGLDVNTASEMKGIDYQVVGDLSACGHAQADSIDVWCCGFNGSYTGCIYKTRIAATAEGIGERGVGSGSSGRPERDGPSILTAASSDKLLASGVLFDAMGRRVFSPKPGVYFVRAVTSKLSVAGCHKVIITR